MSPAGVLPAFATDGATINTGPVLALAMAGQQQGGAPRRAVQYYVDPQGKVVSRPTQAQQPPAPGPYQAQYRYYRRPDGTVVRQRVEETSRAGGPQTATTGTSQEPVRAHPTAMPATKQTAPRPSVQMRAAPRWTAKRVAKHVVVIAVIALLLFASWPMVQQPMRAIWNMATTGQPGFQTFPETADFSILREMSLTANTNSLTYTIDIPKPFHIPGIHERLGLVTAPLPESVFIKSEQEWMKWVGTIPQGGTASISITYHMKLTSTLWDVDAEDSALVSDIPSSYDRYLVKEWKIDPTDANVVDLANRIVGSERNVYNILLKIFRWMDDNLEYKVERSAEPNYCYETLAAMAGDCDDQSILLASLARAVGVPVWLNLGIIYDPVRNYWGGHGWNNVYIPLKGGDYVIATVDIVNDQFLFRDPYHLSDYIDNGDGTELREYYTSWSYSYTGPSPSAKSTETYTVLELDTRGSEIYYKP